jgi:hypothetical protein
MKEPSTRRRDPRHLWLLALLGALSLAAAPAPVPVTVTLLRWPYA